MTTFPEIGINPYGLPLAALCYILLAISIVAERHYLYERWRHQELLRRAVGIVTVLGWMLPVSFIDLQGLILWGCVVFGFGVAGFTKIICDNVAEDNEAVQIQSDILEQVKEIMS